MIVTRVGRGRPISAGSRLDESHRVRNSDHRRGDLSLASHYGNLWAAGSAEGSSSPVYGWIRGIAPAVPQLVLLEVVRRNRQIEVRPGQLRLLSSVVEAKWLKRFRRMLLNVDMRICAAAFDDFTNAPNLNPEYFTEE